MQYCNLLSLRVGVHNRKFRMQIPEVVGESVFDELFCISPITRSNTDLVRKPQHLAVFMSIFHC